MRGPWWSLLLAPALLAAALPARAATDWRTPAEISGYQTTPDYEATLEYLRRLDAASPLVQIVPFGETEERRPLYVVVAAREGLGDPARAHEAGAAVVLLQSGIHPGETEGKDACLDLLRDIALGGKRRLLDHTVLLVIPVINADGHELRSPYNRINQNGPREMGWRTNARRLNLNRDYMKLESAELRAEIALINRWRPHLFVDVHTTDGADFRHDVTYGFAQGPDVPEAILRWARTLVDSAVVPALEAEGHLPAPYIWFRTDEDPSSGFDGGSASPRLSHGYFPLRNMPAVLIETHMLKPYGERVLASYDFLAAILEEVGRRPAALIGAVAQAARMSAEGRPGDPFVLRVADGDSSEPFAYKGYRQTRRWSPIAGAPVASFTKTPWDTLLPYFRFSEAKTIITRPAGYLIPAAWRGAAGHAALHGVRVDTLRAVWEDTVEVYTLSAAFAAAPYEGHHEVTVTRAELHRERRRYGPGDLYIPLDQPLARVVMGLLEPQARDALLAWNWFDAIFEQKEFAEAYVMEPIARRMLEEDPALRKEFEAALVDTAFAHYPAKRLNWFFERSPWRDRAQGVYPIVRVMGAAPPVR
jgi:hypothetical protein